MIFIKIVRRKSLRMEFKTENNNNNNENDKIIKKKCTFGYKQKDNEMEDKSINEIENEIENETEIEIKRGLDDNLKSPFFKEDGNEVEYISETESEIEDDYMDIDIDIDIDADMRSVDENDYGYYDYGLGYEDECYECLDI